MRLFRSTPKLSFDDAGQAHVGAFKHGSGQTMLSYDGETFEAYNEDAASSKQEKPRENQRQHPSLWDDADRAQMNPQNFRDIPLFGKTESPVNLNNSAYPKFPPGITGNTPECPVV